jgi:hypothetical protein
VKNRDKIIYDFSEVNTKDLLVDLLDHLELIPVENSCGSFEFYHRDSEYIKEIRQNEEIEFNRKQKEPDLIDFEDIIEDEEPTEKQLSFIESLEDELNFTLRTPKTKQEASDLIKDYLKYKKEIHSELENYGYDYEFWK